MDVSEVLTEAFGRLPDLVEDAVHGLTAEQLCWIPASRTNSIGWLVWHLTRVQDDHVAELLGEEQIWSKDAWESRFGMPAGSRDTGYGHTARQVEGVRPDGAATLVDYYRAVSDRTLEFLRTLRPGDLDRVVDPSYDPPVTLGVRLVSILDDDTQHVGQAAYLRGLGEALGFPPGAR